MMKDAVLATLFHVASSESENWHSYCPPGTSSWCKFKKDQADITSNYKPGPGLPLDIVAKLKPINKDLSSDVLLSKCLHGKTQNQNESFNATIWDQLPKSRYSGFKQLKFGVYNAIANFNIGRKASVLLYDKLDLIPGRYTVKGCSMKNKKRLFNAGYKNKEVVKTRRKIIRGKKTQKNDKNLGKEGTVYGAGEF